MLNGVKQLNASTCANRFLTSFEMTGKKEGEKQFSDSLGGCTEEAALWMVRIHEVQVAGWEILTEPLRF